MRTLPNHSHSARPAPGGRPRLLVAAFALALLFGAPSSGAAQKLVSEAPSAELSRARAALIGSTEEHKASTAELLRLKEAEIERDAAKLEQLRGLYADGIISRSDLERGETALSESRARLEELRRQIADSERLIAEIEAAEELAKSQPASFAGAALTRRYAPAYRTGGALIRYTGKTGFSPAHFGDVQAFFASAFGRQLPVSAFGQTATHNHLGYDHSRAVDVALHPDSAEGRALIGYLQSRGIAFLAFRSAVPGASTGPHIHIGRPSGRI